MYPLTAIIFMPFWNLDSTFASRRDAERDAETQKVSLSLRHSLRICV
jgi:hypothetical protein